MKWSWCYHVFNAKLGAVSCVSFPITERCGRDRTINESTKHSTLYQVNKTLYHYVEWYVFSMTFKKAFQYK